jgi:hypothetical protein
MELFRVVSQVGRNGITRPAELGGDREKIRNSPCCMMRAVPFPDNQLISFRSIVRHGILDGLCKRECTTESIATRWCVNFLIS